jgi:hypothetical protein
LAAANFRCSLTERSGAGTQEGIEPRPHHYEIGEADFAGHGNFVTAKIVPLNFLAAISEAWRHSGDIKVSRSS